MGTEKCRGWGGGSLLSFSLTIRVLSVQSVLGRARPRQQVIVAAIGHAVVTDAHDLVLLVDDAGADLPEVRERDLDKK